MSSLYPTLEDMKVGELMKAQMQHDQRASGAGDPPIHGSASGPDLTVFSTQQNAISLYPSLSSYMGLELANIAGPNAPAQPGSNALMVAPVSCSNAVGIKRAEIKPGLRKITLCKDGRGKIGMTVKDINKGIFVACVYANSPAALAGLRFGDQILEINGEIVAGFSTDKATKVLRKCRPEKIDIAVRDRPFERTITLNKDSNGLVGFCFKNGGKIISLVKDSSAARNGLLIEHQLVEVDGQNVVGMKDKEIQTVIDHAPQTVTVTIMPSILYEHMVKCIGSSELRKHMDHSIPDV